MVVVGLVIVVVVVMMVVIVMLTIVTMVMMAASEAFAQVMSGDNAVYCSLACRVQSFR